MAKKFLSKKILQIDRDVGIGLITGVTAGLLVLGSQCFAEIYGQKCNLALVAVIALGVVSILILILSHRVKKDTQKGKK